MSKDALRYEPSDKQKVAYNAVHRALRAGVLSRPNQCTRCGKSPPPAADGRSQIQAHHHDYDKPLSVEWICPSCHRVETPQGSNLPPALRGEKNPAAKMSEAQVLLARSLKADGMPTYKIAAYFGVDKKTIRLMLRGETWGWLSASPFAAEKETGQ